MSRRTRGLCGRSPTGLARHWGGPTIPLRCGVYLSPSSPQPRRQIPCIFKTARATCSFPEPRKPLRVEATPETGDFLTSCRPQRNQAQSTGWKPLGRLTLARRAMKRGAEAASSGDVCVVSLCLRVSRARRVLARSRACVSACVPCARPGLCGCVRPTYRTRLRTRGQDAYHASITKLV
jgi:hypothetical protein